uniref:Thioredoxin domain-containing protein n=1 Tax=Helicotheca tamesis TaxID=374047 RepID=A0A7S2I186_9STRA
MVKEITSKEEFDKILSESGDKLIVVDFTASWCAPCKRIAPEFKRMSETYTEVIFLKVDVDNCTALAQEQKVSALPTFKFYKNGTVYYTFNGAIVSGLESGIKKYSASDAEPHFNADGVKPSCVVL